MESAHARVRSASRKRLSNRGAAVLCGAARQLATREEHITRLWTPRIVPDKDPRSQQVDHAGWVDNGDPLARRSMVPARRH